MLWIGVTGCSPVAQSVQLSQTDQVVLDAQNAVGQTFVARYAGLSGMQVILSPNQTGDGLVVLHLRTDNQAEEDLVKVVMPLDQVRQAKPYRFDFFPLKNSNQQYYYAALEVEGTGSLYISASAGNTYQNGGMYQQGMPRDGQLTFSLEYNPGWLAIGLLLELFRWVGVVGLGVLLYILPGWAVLGWLWQGWDALSWLGRVGLASGFSLAAYAIILVFTDLVGLHLGEWYAWGGMIFGVGSLVWQAIIKVRNQHRNQGGQATSENVGSPWSIRMANIAVSVILGLILVTRWWAVRSIEAPMWGDSVQHTVITQLILDHGGLFSSWEPYAPYGTFGNQFGFPAAAALLAWVSGIDAGQAVIWTGQILNVLAVLAIYPLALRLTKGQRWAGVGAVFAAGLVSNMPAFYFNWGRYAQLAGQVILPAALWMLWDVVETPAALRATGGIKALPWGKIILSGAVLGGMVMYQYRTPFYYMTFLLAWVFGWWIPAWRLDMRRWTKAMLMVGIIMVMGILIFFPWGLRVLNSQVSDLAIMDSSGKAILDSIKADYQTWKGMFDYIPPVLAVAAVLAWMWGLIQQEWLVISVGWWIAWLASIYSWNLIHFPGAQQVASFAVLIGLYIPVGLLFGWLVGQIGGFVSRWSYLELLFALIFVGTGIWYAWEQRTIAQPQIYAMVTRPDIRAMDWIRDETSPESLFLVEGFLAYYNTSAVGSDAGWWIPLLAGRGNTMPPLYALGSEIPQELNYSQKIIDTVAALASISLDTDEGMALLCDLDVSHVYIGQLQGLVGLTWLNQLYSPLELLNQPAIQLVYHQDRVFIFELQPGVCER